MTEQQKQQAKSYAKGDCDICHGKGWIEEWRQKHDSRELVCPCAVDNMNDAENDKQDNTQE